MKITEKKHCPVDNFIVNCVEQSRNSISNFESDRRRKYDTPSRQSSEKKIKVVFVKLICQAISTLQTMKFLIALFLCSPRSIQWPGHQWTSWNNRRSQSFHCWSNTHPHSPLTSSQQRWWPTMSSTGDRCCLLPRKFCLNLQKTEKKTEQCKPPIVITCKSEGISLWIWIGQGLLSN